MTLPPDDGQGSPGGPSSPGAPRDASADSPGPPSGSHSRETAAAQDTLARLLDRRATTDGPHAEALLRALVDASPLAMWVLDPDGRVILWNHGAERLTGWRADEALGKPSPIVPPDKMDDFRELFAKALRNEPIVDVEVRRRKKDGSPIDLSLSSAALAAPDGAVVAVLVMATDLRARKEAEETARRLASERVTREAADAARRALEESEARFRNMAEERERLLEAERAARERTERLQMVTASIVETVTVKDVARRVVETVAATTSARSVTLALLTSGGAEFEVAGIAGVSEEVAAKWRRYPADPGYASTEAVRTREPVFLGDPDEIRKRFPKLADSAREHGFAATAVLPLVVAGTPVGTLGLNYATPQPFDAGKRAYLAAVAQQCAQALERARLFEAERAARAEAETARRDADVARAAAEEASRTKSAFLATMSHELRTPLNAIIGYQNLLADGVTGPVSDSQRRQLDRIGSSAHHLLMLIDEVLTLSRVEAGKETVQIEPVDVARVLDEATSIIEPLAKQKNVDFRVVGPETPLVVHSDAGKLRQAVLNLLSNAVKFTGRGSITLRAFGDGDDIVFEVRDTGIGIAKEHLERIFEPFWQVEASTTRTAAGTGLGLAVTRRLAHLLGGDVTVQSLAGEGSTFSLRVPRGGERVAGGG